LKPLSQRTICMALYKNVTNAALLRSQLQDGTLCAALMNINLLVDKLQVLFATSKAAHLFDNGKAKTRTFFSEVLFRLSPSNKIGDCFDMFGISDDTSSFLMLCEEAHYQSAHSKVEGDLCNLSQLHAMHSQEDVIKSYKLSEKEVENNQLLDSVLSSIAVKEIR